MSAEALTKSLQQKYHTLNNTPFNIINVVVNAPDDELANDVTVYVDKESATTLEALSESALIRFGHKLLEDIFFELAAPAQCSLHLMYQFFTTSTVEYEADETYYIGEWWEAEQGYWLARLYLDLIYDEQAKDILIYRSWVQQRPRSYRPEPSKLLGLTNEQGFEQFWELLWQAPVYADLPIKTVTIADRGPQRKQIEIIAAAAVGQKLKKDEYKTIALGWRLFMYAYRFCQPKIRQLEVKLTADEEVLVAFDSHNRRCEYQSWLDDEPTEVSLDEPVVFNGRAKRELKSYLQQRFHSNWLYGRLRVLSIEVSEKDGYQVSVTIKKPLWFYLNPRRLERLMRVMEKLVWDVYNYYDRPRRCTLKVLDESHWYMFVRLDVIEGGYRLIRRAIARHYDPVFFDDGGLLSKLSEPFQKDWDKYRYVYRPMNEIENK